MLAFGEGIGNCPKEKIVVGVGTSGGVIVEPGLAISPVWGMGNIRPVLSTLRVRPWLSSIGEIGSVPIDRELKFGAIPAIPDPDRGADPNADLAPVLLAKGIELALRVD